jgi:hypothetical protein
MASGKESGKAEGGGGEDEAYQGHEDHAEEGGVSSIDHDKEDFGPRLDTSSNLLSLSGGCLGGFVWTVYVQRENADNSSLANRTRETGSSPTAKLQYKELTRSQLLQARMLLYDSPISQIPFTNATIHYTSRGSRDMWTLLETNAPTSLPRPRRQPRSISLNQLPRVHRHPHAPVDARSRPV